MVEGEAADRIRRSMCLLTMVFYLVIFISTIAIRAVRFSSLLLTITKLSWRISYRYLVMSAYSIILNGMLCNEEGRLTMNDDVSCDDNSFAYRASLILASW